MNLYEIIYTVQDKTQWKVVRASNPLEAMAKLQDFVGGGNTVLFKNIRKPDGPVDVVEILE